MEFLGERPQGLRGDITRGDIAITLVIVSGYLGNLSYIKYSH